MRPTAGPVDEVHGLLAPNSSGQPDPVDQRENETFRSAARGSFFTHSDVTELRGPEHDDAPGGLELALDGLDRMLAGDDLPIPPHRQAGCLERPGEGGSSLAVLVRIAEKDVRHGAGCSSVAEVGARSGRQVGRISLTVRRAPR